MGSAVSLAQQCQATSVASDPRDTEATLVIVTARPSVLVKHNLIDDSLWHSAGAGRVIACNSILSLNQ